MIPQYTYPAQQDTFADRAREFFSFEGRLGRQTYWLRALLLWGVNIVAAVLFATAGNAGAATIPMLLVGGAAYIVAFYGSLATTVKRLHDRGRSGWFMLIALIPFVGLWLLVEVGFLAGTPAPNEYGNPV
jgi:uncharacterized membrane protein YhaH (DUF805 family)